VLISSTAGSAGGLPRGLCVTKGALISLTKSLSSELAPKGIMVNWWRRGGWRQRCPRPRWATLSWREDQGRHSVGRVATPREIAGRYFSVYAAGGFISGEVLNVNGGAVLVAEVGRQEEWMKITRVCRWRLRC